MAISKSRLAGLLLPFVLGMVLQVRLNVIQMISVVSLVTPREMNAPLDFEAPSKNGENLPPKQEATSSQETNTVIETNQAVFLESDTPGALNLAENVADAPTISPTFGFVVGNGVNETIVHFPVCEKGVCCGTWDVDLDPWWQNNPLWLVSDENSTHFCFSRMPAKSARDKEHIAFLEALHQLQWHGNCSNVHAKPQINSGLSASLNFLHKGFISAWAANRPFQVTQQRDTFEWKYATYPQNKSGICPTRDVRCYFLPVSNCQARIKQNDGDDRYLEFFTATSGRWLREYFTRPLQHIRRQLFNFRESASMPKLKTPCSVLHVRRTDVTLEGALWKKRKYFPIADYLEHVNVGSNVLLMTDDQSAVDEALGLHPNYTWYFINRTRHYGASGGLNQHLPSKDPLLEMTIILSELRLASQCNRLVHTKSGFVVLIKEALQSTSDDNQLIKIDQDTSKLPNGTWWESSNEFFNKLNMSNVSISSAKTQ